jgi:hypothetical protein
MDRFDGDPLSPDHVGHPADSGTQHDEPEDVMDPRFDDPLSPDYVGPTPSFSAAGFREVVEWLNAPPEDTPERRATFARAREVHYMVVQAMKKTALTRDGEDLDAQQDVPEGAFDPQFDDPYSPDYVGPSLPFSEAGFREVIEALEAPPADTPERRRTFDGARRAQFLVDQFWASEAKRSRK